MTVVNPNLLTFDELRGLLKCSRSKIYDLMKNNKIPYTYVGGDRRFPIDELEDRLGCKLYYNRS